MIKFRTEFHPLKSNLQLRHSDAIVLFGSCFSNHIGSRLEQSKFKALSNPLGISYNPISLHRLFLKIEDPQWHMATDGVFSSSCLHSDFNGLDANQCQQNYEQAFSKLDSTLKQAKVIFITYGSAFVYENIEEKKIANNCHKRDASIFRKRLLSIDEIVSSWEKTVSKLKETYQKDFQFIFTLSPVRHIKDGFHENQLSKSTLLLAIEEICSSSANCSYFPAYELLLDDLRDYRFYENDLLHPNEVAINYVWEKFTSVFFSKETQELNVRIQKLQRSMQHRPFIQQSDQHLTFLKTLEDKMLSIQKEEIDFSSEIASIKNQLADLR